MQDAIDQMDTIYKALEACECAKNIQIDFSIVNDIDYYNGVIFRGYIEKLARIVLAGGQYDSAMKKFGKDLDAIGFALYLNELSMLVEDNKKTDVDALVLYQQDTKLSDVIKAVSALKAEGLRVRAEKSIPRGLRFLKKYRIEGGKWIEEAEKC
jgi:ATP phosphoribosyltransferase regulatory subunit